MAYDPAIPTIRQMPEAKLGSIPGYPSAGSMYETDRAPLLNLGTGPRLPSQPVPLNPAAEPYLHALRSMSQPAIEAAVNPWDAAGDALKKEWGTKFRNAIPEVATTGDPPSRGPSGKFGLWEPREDRLERGWDAFHARKAEGFPGGPTPAEAGILRDYGMLAEWDSEVAAGRTLQRTASELRNEFRNRFSTGLKQSFVPGPVVEKDYAQLADLRARVDAFVLDSYAPSAPARTANAAVAAAAPFGLADEFVAPHALPAEGLLGQAGEFVGGTAGGLAKLQAASALTAPLAGAGPVAQAINKLVGSGSSPLRRVAGQALHSLVGNTLAFGAADQASLPLDSSLGERADAAKRSTKTAALFSVAPGLEALPKVGRAAALAATASVGAASAGPDATLEERLQGAATAVGFRLWGSRKSKAAKVKEVEKQIKLQADLASPSTGSEFFGVPLVHYTKSNFDVFDPSLTGKNKFNLGDLGRGSYFATQKFVDRLGEGLYERSYGPIKKEVRVDIRRPLVVEEFPAKRASYADKARAKAVLKPLEDHLRKTTPEAAEFMSGAFYKNLVSMYGNSQKAYNSLVNRFGDQVNAFVGKRYDAVVWKQDGDIYEVATQNPAAIRGKAKVSGADGATPPTPKQIRALAKEAVEADYSGVVKALMDEARSETVGRAIFNYGPASR